MSEIYDLAVIGGGSAGLVAAGGAGLLGARVVLVEKRALGGDCLYTGCVPSKTLIRSARFAHEARNAQRYGFEIPDLKFGENSFATVTNRVRRVIETIEEHDSPARFEKMGVEVVFGAPRFLNPREIEVSLSGSGEKRVIKARRFCLATGSSAAIPPVEGLSETGFLTNENVFELKNLPQKLIVLGGGAIGVELGQAFARFGSRVSLIERSDRLLAKEDSEISEFITEILRGENLEIHTKAKAVRVRRENTRKILTIETDGKQRDIEADEILAATGRRANVDGLNLEAAGVRVEKNRVWTNEFLQTSARHIFAAGDVTGHFQFTHTADYEAQIVLNNAFLFWGLRKKTDFRAVPWATFTAPEIGRVGLTETDAREKFGARIKIYRARFTENDRAQAENEVAGFAKIVCRANGEIVGAHIAGAGAGEIIHEFVWAIKKRWKIAQLNEIIHVYPTLAKITQAVATESTIETLQSPFAQKWFARYLRIWRR